VLKIGEILKMFEILFFLLFSFSPSFPTTTMTDQGGRRLTTASAPPDDFLEGFRASADGGSRSRSSSITSRDSSRRAYQTLKTTYSPGTETFALCPTDESDLGYFLGYVIVRILSFGVSPLVSPVNLLTFSSGSLILFYPIFFFFFLFSSFFFFFFSDVPTSISVLSLFLSSLLSPRCCLVRTHVF